MTISTHIKRLTKTAALVLAIAALVVPVCQAGDIVVDDYWRDSTTALSSGPVVDDYFRDAAPLSPRPIVDDYFRDAAPLSPRPIVDDWFRDGASLAADERLLAASMADAIAASTPGRMNVVGDDWFRDAHRNGASIAAGESFGWGDFGIGAGSMLAAMVLLIGLSGATLGAKGRRMLSQA